MEIRDPECQLRALAQRREHAEVIAAIESRICRDQHPFVSGDPFKVPAGFDVSNHVLAKLIEVLPPVKLSGLHPALKCFKRAATRPRPS